MKGERAVYALGLDLGTTFTAAGVWREGRAEIASLGTRSAVIPSVVLLRSDESVLVGEAAVRRAVVEPDRVAREFKRRLGDSTPLLLGGVPFSAQALMARVLASVVGQVAAAQGGLPERVCLCHPANWGMFKTDLLGQVVRLADLEVPVSLITEPEAAAVFYGQEQRLAVGESVAVYDLGGGTFDAAVLTRTEEGFAVVGQPEGIERLGGVDVDAAVFRHVMRSVPEAFAGLDEEDPAAVAAVARVRTECTEAKEALSSDTDVTIPVMLPGVTTEVRLTRAELEAMVRPSLYDSIEALKRAVRSAGLTPADLAAVLLVGGASRMPLVAQLVGSELGRPVVVDAHPKHSVALGAAWLASGHTLAAPAVAPSTVAVTTQARPEARPAAPVPDTSPTPPSRPTVAAASPLGAPTATPVVPARRQATPQGRQAPPVPPVPLALPVAPVAPTTAVDQAWPPLAPAEDPLGAARRRNDGGAVPPPGSPSSAQWPLDPGHAPETRATSRRRVPVVAVLTVLLFALAAAGFVWWRRDAPPPAQGAVGAVSAATTSAAGTAAASTAVAADPPPAGSATGWVTVTFQGSGSVSGALACKTTCTAELARSRTVALRAAPATGYTFTRWTGCDRTDGRTCTVTVEDSSALGVVFTKTDATRTTSTSTSRTATTTATTSTAAGSTAAPSDSPTAG